MTTDESGKVKLRKMWAAVLRCGMTRDDMVLAVYLSNAEATIVGGGMSRPIYALWPDDLRELITRAVTMARVVTLRNDFRYSAADILRELLGEK